MEAEGAAAEIDQSRADAAGFVSIDLEQAYLDRRRSRIESQKQVSVRHGASLVKAIFVDSTRCEGTVPHTAKTGVPSNCKKSRRWSWRKRLLRCS
jgi:hypothetical protein